MARDFQRAQRFSQHVLRELAQLLREELRDPRIGFVTLTDVEVSRDLAHAKVWFSLLDPDADLEGTSRALQRAAGYLRSRLGERVQARTVPQLEFVYDGTSARAARMDDIFRQLHDTAGSDAAGNADAAPPAGDADEAPSKAPAATPHSGTAGGDGR